MQRSGAGTTVKSACCSDRCTDHIERFGRGVEGQSDCPGSSRPPRDMPCMRSRDEGEAGARRRAVHFVVPTYIRLKLGACGQTAKGLPTARQVCTAFIPVRTTKNAKPPTALHCAHGLPVGPFQSSSDGTHGATRPWPLPRGTAAGIACRCAQAHAVHVDGGEVLRSQEGSSSAVPPRCRCSRCHNLTLPLGCCMHCDPSHAQAFTCEPQRQPPCMALTGSFCPPQSPPAPPANPTSAPLAAGTTASVVLQRVVVGPLPMAHSLQ